MPLEYLNFKKKLFLETMQFMQKQFPVNWLTSGRLAFVVPRTKARQCQQMKNGGLNGGTMGNCNWNIKVGKVVLRRG